MGSIKDRNGMQKQKILRSGGKNTQKNCTKKIFTTQIIIPLQKEMATYSSILAWKVALTEEPGGPQSLGSQRLGYSLYNGLIITTTTKW